LPLGEIGEAKLVLTDALLNAAAPSPGKADGRTPEQMIERS
jgi:hypothetical protein